MKTRKTEIDIDFIGGMGPLTENEEKALSKFFKKKNSLPAKRIVRTTLNKKKKEHSEK
jgi:hypothetical protein